MESNTDTTRKLASIQTITAIEEHTQADALELATILGWQVIIRKSEVHVGDKVIYCEIDSLLPVNAPWLPPSIKEKVNKTGIQDFYHVKTAKIRRELSQGLIIPIDSSLPDSTTLAAMDNDTDVTQLLGILKYEPPALTGKYSSLSDGGSKFPTELISKTDEPRIQSHPKLFKLLQNKQYYSTVKLDGTSATYVINPKTSDLLVCSRNLIKKKVPNDDECSPYWHIAYKYNIEGKLAQIPHMAIQGEICGPNVQRNFLGLKSLELFVFNVTDIRNGKRLLYNEMRDFCQKIGLKVVPLVDSGVFQYDSIKALLIKACGNYDGTKNPREGLVIRSVDQQISFKVINNDYLLKYGY